MIYAQSTRGPTVYTAFITTRKTLADRESDFQALDWALEQALSWMSKHSAAEITALVRDYFVDLSEDDLIDSITRYSQSAVWSDKTLVDRAGFDRLSESFYRGGAIRAPAQYEHCVFNFGD